MMPDDFMVYRRRLPHWRLDGGLYFVTWRLARGAAELMGVERDAVASALHHFNRQRYALLAYVIMNDHLHVLVQPADGFALQDIVKSWKAYSARRLRHAGRAAPVWQQEYFDRVMRNRHDVFETLEYISKNPTRRWAGIESYPWFWVDRSGLE